jgi:hypothetical protein
MQIFGTTFRSKEPFKDLAVEGRIIQVIAQAIDTPVGN